MGIVARLFTRPQKEAAEHEVSRAADGTREQTRRELLAMAVRDTLKRHGVAHGCITAEGIQGIAGGRRGMHLQLVFREWQPGVLNHVVSLQTLIRARLLRLDPLSATWLTGISWRFEPANEQEWPRLAAGASVPVLRPAPVPKASLDMLLAARDGAFGLRKGQHEDFSPTLPMQGA